MTYFYTLGVEMYYFSTVFNILNIDNEVDIGLLKGIILKEKLPHTVLLVMLLKFIVNC